jgi:hypothetical protein
LLLVAEVQVVLLLIFAQVQAVVLVGLELHQV